MRCHTSRQLPVRRERYRPGVAERQGHLGRDMPAYQSLDARRLEGALRPLLRGDVKARAETIG